MDTPLTMYQVAERLDVCLPVAYRLVKSGALPSCRVGRLWRVSEAALDRFLQGEPGPHDTKETKSEAA